MERYSKINLRGTKETEKTVKITSDSKPSIDTAIVEKWQALIDTIAKIVNVPSGLIMRLNEKTIEVFLKSNTEGNPYEEGEEAELVYSLYCETVIGTQDELLVPDATKSPVWSTNNPDIDLDMISYLGLPINWPDGECFGTVCLLDNKENHYTENFKHLLEQVRVLIETDLQLLLKSDALEKKNKQLDQLNSLKTKILSLITHDARGSFSSAIMLLDLVISEFDDYDRSELRSLLLKMSDSINFSYSTIEDILNWAKQDLIQLQPELKPLDIMKIIDDILSVYRHSIDVKNITVVRDYSSEELNITGDKYMMTSIIRNLLSNAVKYTDKDGTIIIRIFQKNGQHVLEIEDDGIGMKPTTLDNLFEYDANHASQGTAGESSSGIGLILVKEFIDKQDASISVKSEFGKGTTFSIAL